VKLMFALLTAFSPRPKPEPRPAILDFGIDSNGWLYRII
jgi:hypothetical protein